MKNGQKAPNFHPLCRVTTGDGKKIPPALCPQKSADAISARGDKCKLEEFGRAKKKKGQNKPAKRVTKFLQSKTLFCSGKFLLIYLLNISIHIFNEKYDEVFTE